jgi:hypothetical protein
VLALKILAGALVGGAVGFLIGRARTCTAAKCNVKANRIAYAIAGAVFGAGVAFYYTAS